MGCEVRKKKRSVSTGLAHTRAGPAHLELCLDLLAVLEGGALRAHLVDLALEVGREGLGQRGRGRRTL
jgi:hypothetical protein